MKFNITIGLKYGSTMKYTISANSLREARLKEFLLDQDSAFQQKKDIVLLLE